jgi:hypothetical protein
VTFGARVAAFTTRRPFAAAALGLTFLAGLIAIDSVFFREVLDRGYVRWYLENGALLTLAVTLVTVAWPDLNDYYNLISAHPVRYMQAWFGLFGFTFKSMPDGKVPLYVYHGGKGGRAVRNAWDLLDLTEALLLFVWGAVILAAVLVWILVIAPLQYFVFLASGVLARAAQHSSQKAIVRMSEPGNQHDFEIDATLVRAAPPPGWMESAFFSRPFALTSALAAALLFALSFLV